MQWQEIQAPTIIKIIPQVHTWGSLSYKKKICGGKENNIKSDFPYIAHSTVKDISTLFFFKR